MDRRKFLERTVKLFSAAIGALLGLPVVRFVASSFAASPEQLHYPIGSASQLQEEVTRVSFKRLLRDGWMVRTIDEYVWVRKKPDGEIVVFEPHCTHLGCAYAWNNQMQQFACPCHGGRFDKDGNRIAGPPPRPLDRFAVTVEANQIKIGKLLKT
jgi:quinol---cytochrome c reductase iron-sulfur subunit, bacillus type